MTRQQNIESAIRSATDKNIDVWLENTRLAEVFGRSARRAPLEVWAFVGEPFAGKTKTAHEAAKLLSAPEDIIVYDMAQFPHPWQVAPLIGFPFGRNNTTIVPLTDLLIVKPARTVIFDNFDKAHPEIQSIVRAAIAAGTLHNSEARPVPLTGATFLITADTDRKGFINMMRDDRHKRLSAPYKIVTIKKDTPDERYKRRLINVNGKALGPFNMKGR